MKWRDLLITVFKCLGYLSNCNKQVFKINFKPLLKWTFAQNLCCRFWNDEQLSCSMFFELPHKNGRKIWISKCIGPFQVHSSFKFYLSNEDSNELLPETKVVDLEILNNFHVGGFSSWHAKTWEEFEFWKGPYFEFARV